jgi:hypothetical protein
MEETIKRHFKISEVFYYRNDPAGHNTHVHFAPFGPWGRPDEFDAPSPCVDAFTIPALLPEFRALVEKEFGTRWSGTYVCKHRNWDPLDPWSQHAFKKALDESCDHATQDAIVAWLDSPFEEDDMAKVAQEEWDLLFSYVRELDHAGITPMENARSIAFVWGLQKHAKGDRRPRDDEPSSREQQAGWDFGQALVPQKE